MEYHHFSHQHPLVFTGEQSSEDQKDSCSGCGELVSGPSFCCAECGFYLHKKCFEASSELNHPFHPDHNLQLLASPPYLGSWAICSFCDRSCKNFVYHCSCKLDFHIECALFSKAIAENRFGEFDDVSLKDPLVSSEKNQTENLKETECFACRKPLLDSPHVSLGSGFHMHRKCLGLPAEISHLLHSQHPLVLQFNGQRLPCQICRETQLRGLVYCCSPCKFVLHVACAEQPTKINHPCHREHPLILRIDSADLTGLLCRICQGTHGFLSVYYCSVCKFGLHAKCVSPTPTIKGEIHEHAFTLFWRQVPFICDACGTRGDCVSYICSPCGLIVHEKCISLQPTIKRFPRHRHPISHTFFLGKYETRAGKCKICSEEVNSNHGCYCCSGCNYLVHANCAKEDYSYYLLCDDSEDMDELLNKNSAFFVIKETMFEENVVVPTEIKHVSHPHNLIFVDDVKDDRYCDGCMLFISTSFYYCSQCDFFLHKSCAELPQKMYYWGHIHLRPITLVSVGIIQCWNCLFQFNNGLAYQCNLCKGCFCLFCVQNSDTTASQGHEHPLTYYEKYEGHCNGCGNKLVQANACKECNFAVDYYCLRLPDKIRHKCDEHPLMLTYHDNIYSEYNYCDICERSKNPSHWFYHCAICDSSVHRSCAIDDRYAFMKSGKSYASKDHPHPLTFTRKVYDYPECHICRRHCDDLSVECRQSRCNYIVHWRCIDPFYSTWVFS